MSNKIYIDGSTEMNDQNQGRLMTNSDPAIETIDKRRPQGGLYYVIPAFVFECPDLECSEIVFYALVSGLALNKGYCFASDEYLSERMGVDERTIRKWFSKLEKFGFLKRETERSGMFWKRKIHVILGNVNKDYEGNHEPASNGIKKISTKGTPGPDTKAPQGLIVGKVLVSKETTPTPSKPSIPSSQTQKERWWLSISKDPSITREEYERAYEEFLNQPKGEVEKPVGWLRGFIANKRGEYVNLAQRERDIDANRKESYEKMEICKDVEAFPDRVIFYRGTKEPVVVKYDLPKKAWKAQTEILFEQRKK